MIFIVLNRKAILNTYRIENDWMENDGMRPRGMGRNEIEWNGIFTCVSEKVRCMWLFCILMRGKNSI